MGCWVPRGRRRGEDGAVMPIMAAMITVLVLIAAFAVDLGMQRVARRDMQALADVVAVDLARLLDGRTAGTIRAGSGTARSLDAVLADSLARNGESTLGEPPEVRAYLVDVDAAGRYQRSATGAPLEVAAGAVPDAVVVTADTDVAFAFAGVVGASDGAVSRSATATADGGACFSLGTYAASVNSEQSSLLGPLLGDSLGLTAVGYQGLVGLRSTVPLIDLALELGVGTADELARTSVSMEDLYLALADVLQRQGNTAEAKILADAATLVVGRLSPITIGDLVALTPGADAALESSVNVLDLVTGAAFIADGKNAVRLQDLGIAVPPLTNLTGELTLIEKPQFACGRRGTTKESSQVGLSLNGELLNASTGTFPGLGPLLSALADVQVSVKPSVTLAGATGRGVLKDIRCTPGSPSDGITVGVTGRLAKTTVRAPIVIRAKALGGLVDIRIGMIATVSNPTGTAPEIDRDMSIDVPSQRWETPYSAGASGLGVGSASISLAYNPEVSSSSYIVTGGVTALLAPLLNPILNGLLGNLTPIASAVLQPILTSLDSLVLGPVQRLAGLNVAGVDVIAHRQPLCNLPKLIG